MRSLITLIACLTFAGSVFAAQDTEHTATPSGQAVPRFVSLKVDVANGRSGPSSQHPIAWRYLRAGLPMEVIAETPDWRRVRDPEGEVTWMHRSILSGRRSVYTLEETSLHARDSESSPIEAVAGAGVILSLERCRTGWCRVEAQGFRGWVRPHTLWGVYPQELDSETGPDVDGNPALSPSVAHDTALP
ncbi:SH3 domain-containing protein [Maricaulis sp.]|jgi:SH3-like domain-containing protein|uniref:SH3 domain-containing protein n=1 Tax=Maricaulis sp. TaxID=1486257 RepID=UPI0026100E81|nr:SH3 domain-containing protein [Maricaulis sp.]MDF1767584.1 SH3 domain-containing protein [Maricaulis sp.]